MEKHRLRYYVHAESVISDVELDEVETLIDFDAYRDQEQYEYNGNFIFTKNSLDRDEAVYGMCCGIVTKDIELANEVIIYFAFDYGH